MKFALDTALSNIIGKLSNYDNDNGINKLSQTSQTLQKHIFNRQILDI